MRRSVNRALLAALAAALEACSGGGAEEGPPAARSPATVRAARRAFDGAPPVIPHAPFGMACSSCHGASGVQVEGVGYAPPSPHEATAGLGASARCLQCHVFRETAAVFVASAFEGLRQDLRRGRRLNPLAPPVIPHQTLLRENCAACHTGPAAREEIRCTHPERVRCTQCHVAVQASEEFLR
ncbi:MAG: hypothetical protein HY721_29715 [Planctomycetes bacterium]|nr:hypothetical protein [Planctomycetota bacterium]